jgi:hypothetical protein
MSNYKGNTVISSHWDDTIAEGQSLRRQIIYSPEAKAAMERTAKVSDAILHSFKTGEKLEPAGHELSARFVHVSNSAPRVSVAAESTRPMRTDAELHRFNPAHRTYVSPHFESNTQVSVQFLPGHDQDPKFEISI